MTTRPAGGNVFRENGRPVGIPSAGEACFIPVFPGSAGDWALRDGGAEFGCGGAAAPFPGHTHLPPDLIKCLDSRRKADSSFSAILLRSPGPALSGTTTL
jgi:hypothetical protein